MNAVYSNKKSTHQSASFQFPYFITFGRESLPHQCNQGNRIIYSFTGVMFYKVVQHKSWRCKWRNSNAKLLTCSEINDQKQCACCHVSRGAGVPSVSHSHSKAFRLLSQTVRLPIQQHELPAVCCMLTVQVSCNQDFEYSKKKTTNKQQQQQPKPGKVFFDDLTSLTQDAFAVCGGPVFGPAASFHLSAAGSLQHQDLWRQEILQHDSDEHHQHGLKLQFIFAIPFFIVFLDIFLYLICLRLEHL